MGSENTANQSVNKMLYAALAFMAAIAGWGGKHTVDSYAARVDDIDTRLETHITTGQHPGVMEAIGTLQASNSHLRKDIERLELAVRDLSRLVHDDINSLRQEIKKR